LSTRRASAAQAIASRRCAALRCAALLAKVPDEVFLEPLEAGMELKRRSGGEARLH